VLPGPAERAVPPPEGGTEPLEDAQPSSLRALRAPKDPTQQEIDDHEAAGQSPYRSWCRACVAGAGRRDRHLRQLKDEEKAVPTISADYAFMGGRGPEGKGRASDLPILITKCDADRWVTSDPVPAKGTSASLHGARCLAEAIVQSGFPKVIVKTDNEPAILELKREAVKLAREEVNVEIILEESMDYVSETNGPCEIAVKQVEEKVRTLKYGVEMMHGVKLPDDHPVLKWAVRYAGQIMSRAHRYEVDGRTAYELRKGKSYKRKLPIFGEKVSAMTLGKRRMRSEYRCFDAIFLGLVARSDMLLVGNQDGCFKVACVKRMSPGQRRDADMLLGLVGLPWRPNPQGAPGEEAPLRVCAEPVIEEEELPRAVKPVVPDVTRRQVYIRKDKELAKYGFTPGCAGCAAAQAGARPMAHSVECRQRIMDKMEQDEEGRLRLTQALVRASAPELSEPKRARIDRGPEERVATPSGSAELAGGGQPSGGAGSPAAVPAGQLGVASGSAASPAAAASNEDWNMKAARARAGDSADRELQSKKTRTDDKDEVMQLINGARALSGCLPLDRLEINDLEPALDQLFVKNLMPSQSNDSALPPGIALNTSAWNLGSKDRREQLELWRNLHDPIVIIGTSSCPAAPTGGHEQHRAHTSFLAQQYVKQIDDNRYFVHFVPAWTAAWSEGPLRKLVNHDLVCRIESGNSFAITNSPEIAKELRRRRAADVKSAARQITKGILRQCKIDQNLQLHSMDIGVHVDEEAISWDEPDEVEAQYYDDISGALLDPKLVSEARRKEIEFVHQFGVYEKVPKEQAIGKTKVSIKWVDVNKGDAGMPEYRSRLVGRELRRWDPFMSGTFAATPPTEALRFMLSNFMTRKVRAGKRKELVMTVLDVSRAHFHPPAEREVYIDLPPEDDEPGMVGRLLRTIYGTRDAAAQWEKYYSEVFAALGFVTGNFSPCLFHHPDRDLAVWVHGDDMLILGEKPEAETLEQELREHMLLKRRALLGWRPDEDKNITVLNRIIELHANYKGSGDRALTYEPDARHVEIAVKAMSLDGASAKAVGTPVIRSEEYLDDTPLHGNDITLFRSVCMRLSFLAVDWPHLLYPSKEVARKMQKPTKGAMARLKRVVRYLKGSPRCVQVYKPQDEVSELFMLTDSDYAGCLETRKSTSSCFLWRGGHLIRATSSTQGIQGLSSGESEFMALVRGCSILLGAGAMARDLGYSFALRAGTDSSTAKSVAERRGVGKIRHLHTPLLWLQTKCSKGEIKISKVSNKVNWSDLATKVHDQKWMMECLSACGFEVLAGKSKLALDAAL